MITRGDLGRLNALEHLRAAIVRTQPPLGARTFVVFHRGTPTRSGFVRLLLDVLALHAPR
ncbi:MAG: hypothetical protein KF773_34425 [Deltaproteobacteria bacterium]|nr:hypothetical protein [Deltaproteobacteria bacterium]MCW5804472.1 hypothetical protein [Deltaproteobacteria bacterium]